jgi:hypothetical protein
MTTDMPWPLMIALHVRDAAGLEVRSDVVVPQLVPEVPLDGALAPYATEDAAAQWGEWWDSLLDRHPEFDGLPPRLLDRFPPLPEHLRALIEVELPTAEAWYNARKREDLDQLRATGRPPAVLPIGRVVQEVERELGRPAAPFDLLISLLPVYGSWGRRVRRDHVLISRGLGREAAEFEAFLAPVVRELAE